MRGERIRVSRPIAAQDDVGRLQAPLKRSAGILIGLSERTTTGAGLAVDMIGDGIEQACRLASADRREYGLARVRAKIAASIRTSRAR